MSTSAVVPPTSSHMQTVNAVSLVRNMVHALVDYPEAVTIESEDTGHANTSIHVTVAASDVGQVIGKQGRTARSLRTILGAISTKGGHRYNLDIVESTA